MNSTELQQSLRPLPPNKSVVDIFADFLQYLYTCAKQFIIETHPNGAALWNSVADRKEFMLSHPNGWEGLQQGKMRQAAVMAGLVPDNAVGHQRVHFVTEGEASVHYCIERESAGHVMKVGDILLRRRALRTDASMCHLGWRDDHRN